MRDEGDVLKEGAAIIALRMSEGHREREREKRERERETIERKKETCLRTSMAVIWAKLCAKDSPFFKRYASLFTYHDVISDCN